MAGARLVGLGRDGPHVAAQLRRDLAQRVQPRRVDAVVVGEKDAHGGIVSAKFDAVAMRGSRELGVGNSLASCPLFAIPYSPLPTPPSPMPKITIYTIRYCPYCERAKRLLAQ